MENVDKQLAEIVNYKKLIAEMAIFIKFKRGYMSAEDNRTAKNILSKVKCYVEFNEYLEEYL